MMERRNRAWGRPSRKSEKQKHREKIEALAKDANDLLRRLVEAQRAAAKAAGQQP